MLIGVFGSGVADSRLSPICSLSLDGQAGGTRAIGVGTVRGAACFDESFPAFGYHGDRWGRAAVGACG